MKIGLTIGRELEPHSASSRDAHTGFDALLKEANRGPRRTRTTDEAPSNVAAAKQPARGPQVAKPALDDAAAMDAPVDVAIDRSEVSAEVVAMSPNDAASFLTAISHAIAALRGNPAPIATPAVPIEAPAIDTPAIATPTLTPLEQAVHDMLAELAPVHARGAEPHEDHDEPADLPAPANTNAPLATTAPAPTHESAPRATHAAEPPPALREMQAPEMPVAQSHVHLVVGDDAERVVVTVAVRGNDVNVALRAGDEHTAAALARNAGALDHALRTRGLDLASFSAQRDPDRRRREQPQRERPPESQQPFVLEQS